MNKNIDESTVADMMLGVLTDADISLIKENGINYIYPSGMTALGLAVLYFSEENALLLLQNGADPNVFGEDADPPLYDAYISHMPRMLILLLMYGANPELKGDEGIFSPMEVLNRLGLEDFFEPVFDAPNSPRVQEQ